MNEEEYTPENLIREINKLDTEYVWGYDKTRMLFIKIPRIKMTIEAEYKGKKYGPYEMKDLSEGFIIDTYTLSEEDAIKIERLPWINVKE